MTPEQKADWDKTVDVARERNDHSLRRWHMVDAYSDAILAANETIATLTRERDSLRQERDQARDALEKILATRNNPEPPSLKLFDIYHIAGAALAATEEEKADD